MAICVSTEIAEEELRPHLDTLLTALQERQEGAAKQILDSWILASLAHILRMTSMRLKALMIVSQLAGEASASRRYEEAGLGTALLSLLSSTDEDVLLQTCLTIGRICCDDSLLQDHLIRKGAITLLAAILKKYPGKQVLVSAALFTVCSLADMGEKDSQELSWEQLGRVSEGQYIYRGTHRQSCGFSSKVTMVRLIQWSGTQNVVTVEVVYRCSRILWSALIAEQTNRPRWLTLFGVGPYFYRIIKSGIGKILKA